MTIKERSISVDGTETFTKAERLARDNAIRFTMVDGSTIIWGSAKE